MSSIQSKRRGAKKGRGFGDTVRGRLARMMDFPESCFSPVPYLELQGDARLSITGYETLLRYDEETILFRMRQYGDGGFSLLRINGEDLTISVLRQGCLSIGGCIHAVILHEQKNTAAGDGL